LIAAKAWSALDRFGNGFRIHKVVLAGLHKGLYEQCCDQPDIVVLVLQCSTEEMCSGTGFEAYERR
jgi:hypothetical protein